MANSRIQYTLGFNVDSGDAKKQLEQLSSTLKQISNMEIELIDSGDIQDIQAASKAARELNSALSAATNKSTGKLDLSLFKKSLASSKQDLSELLLNISAAGRNGTQAFQQLAKAVTSAHMPIKQSSKLLNDFATTMKNTIKWQISSNIVHGLQSGLEGAIGYAKNLNASLTDIRIVTGASADEMARFAKNANSAAKQLATSTLDYTKASLIYYQQGDSDAQVRKKAEITLKAANSSFNTSTQEMSEYLTAVWNSYQVGADELERYVDIMAALGAKTATSLEEIATSMQKVAATGNTVGVSMEQVSSIIATVSSVTRESAESIGTSYKTIFARMGDLKLGKTDEDGIGLGQVSSSLEKIGVRVLDATGDLREMGDIITDLGNKWQTMTGAEKTAIAQVVAGKRQYTQLMALFENWDMYNQNLEIAGDSEGALQEMQDIYAESWAAASKRVKASLESVYGAIINDKVIINITNNVADLIDKVYSLVDAFGGLGPVLGGIGAIFMKNMKPQMADGITKFINNLELSSGVAQEKFVKNQREVFTTMQESVLLADNQDLNAVVGYYSNLQQAQADVVLSGKRYTEQQIAQIDSVIQKIQEQIERETQLAQIKSERKTESANRGLDLEDQIAMSLAEDMTPDGIDWNSLRGSQRRDELNTIKNEEGFFSSDQLTGLRDSFKAIFEKGETFEDLEIRVDTGDSVQEVRALGLEIKNVTSLVAAFRLANKAIGKARTGLGQVENIERQMNKSGRANADTLNQAKQFQKAIEALNLGKTIKDELDISEEIKAAEEGSAEQLEQLRIRLTTALEATKSQLNAAIDDAEIFSAQAGQVMGNNADRRSVGQTAEAAQAEGAAEAVPGTAENLNNVEEMKKALQEAAGPTREFAQSLSDLVEGTVSCVSGFSMMTSGLEGLVNGTSSVTESFMAMGSGLAMMLSGIGSVVGNIKSLKTGYDKLNDSLLKYLNLRTKSLLQDQGIMGNIARKILLRKAEKSATDGVAQAQKRLEMTSSSTLGVTMAIIAAIAALVIGINALIQNQKKLRAEASKTAQEEMDAIKEKAEEANKESKAINETMGTYKALRDEYDKTGVAKEEYKTATEAVLEALGLEGLKVDETREKYAELAGIIDYTNGKRLRDNLNEVKEAERQLAISRRTYLDGLDDGEDWNSGSMGYVQNPGQGTKNEKYRFQYAGKNLWSQAGDKGIWGSERAMYDDFSKIGITQNYQDFDISADPKALLQAYYGMIEMSERYAGLKDSAQWQAMFNAVSEMASKEEAIRFQEAEAKAWLSQDNWMSKENYLANNKGKTSEDYFNYIEEETLKYFTDLGLDPKVAQDSVDSIVESWVAGLSLDDEYADYKINKAINEMYAEDPNAQKQRDREKANQKYIKESETYDKYLEAAAALKAAPDAKETRDLLESLGLKPEDNIEEKIENQKVARDSAWSELQSSEKTLALATRQDLLNIIGGIHNHEDAQNYSTTTEGSIRLLNAATNKLEGLENQLNENLNESVSPDDKNLTLSALEGVVSEYNYDPEFHAGVAGEVEWYKKQREIISNLITTLGFTEESFLEYAASQYGISPEKLTIGQLSQAAFDASQNQRTYLNTEGEAILQDAQYENIPEVQAEEVTLENYGKIDTGKVFQDFESFAGLSKQTDILDLSNEAFNSFVERLGEEYANMDKTDFAEMSEDEWNKMLIEAGDQLIPLMNALGEAGHLTQKQMSQLINESAEDAVRAHEAAQAAWEKIISLTQEDSDKEWALTEKQNANTKAAEALENGQTYDELDPWTKMWLQEQYGEAAKQSGANDIGSYIELQGGIDFLLAMNESLMASQGQLYEDVFSLTKSIVDASLQEGAYDKKSGKYIISIDDIEFTDDNQKAQFLQDYANELTEDGSKVKIDTEQMSKIRAQAEEVAGYLDLAQQGENIRFEALADSVGATVAELKAYAETIMQINGDTREFNELSYNEQEHLLNVAAAAKKAEKGWEELNSSYEENIKTLRESDKTSIKYANSLQSMTKSMKKIFNDSESVTEDFVENHLDDIEKMAEGDEEAFERIQDELLKLDLEGSYNFDIGVDIDGDGATEQLGTLIDNWEDMLADEPIGTTVDINTGPATAALLDLVNAGGETASAIMAALNSIGWEPQVEYVEASLNEYSDGQGNVTVPVIGYVNGIPQITGWTTEPITSEMEAAGSVLIPKIGNGPVAPGGGIGQQVKISGFTKTSSGRTGGSSKNSGGGGGGKKEKKDYKRFEDEVERYHVQNENLERIGEELDRIDKLKDRTYGKDHVAQLNAETEALREQYEAQVDLRNEALKWQAIDQAELIALNVGVQFSENGNISNYEEVRQALIDKYNAEVELYNNSAQEEGDKLRLENAEEAYEEAVKAIENYEEAVEIANQALNDMEEILNQISEIELEKITYQLELDIEVNERDIELLEYFQEKYADVLSRQDDVFHSLMQTAGEYQSNLSELGQAYNQLVAAYNNGNGPLQQDEFAEGLADLSDQIISNLSELKNLEQEIAETYSHTLELAREEIDKTLGALDHFNSAMQSYISIAQLSGVEFFQMDGKTFSNTFKGLDAFYDAQYKNNLNRILIQKEHLDTLLEEEERFRDKIASGQQLTDLEKEQYAALQEEIQETREGVLSATEETLQTLQEGYENTINGIAADLDAFMAGAAGSLAHLAEQYSYFQEEQSRYVSTARELYEVSSLTRDIENTIADASSAASKEALKALQEKIEKQSELNELTEYDIQMNQLQYQLLLARIQLEEAQNAKDTVRLTRDDNGNYAYQYTADQGRIDEAVQNYEDVLQQINDLTAERTSEIEQGMINSMQEYQAKIQEIALDTTLTEEQKYARMEELYNQFSATMSYWQEQDAIATENLTFNQEAIASHYGVNMAEITASTAGNVNETVQSMIDKTEEYIAAMGAAIFGEEGAVAAWSEYAESIAAINAAAGTSYENMISNSEEMGEANEYATQEALNTIATLEDTLEPLGNLTEAWNVHNVALQNAIEYYEQLANTISETMATIGETDAIGGIAMPAASSEQARYGQYFNDIMSDSSLTSVQRSERLKTALSAFQDVSQSQMNQQIPSPSNLSGYSRSEGMSEQNYEIYEMILAKIDNLTAMQALSAFTASGVATAEKKEIVQEITIQADFPNATDQNEIREAFDTLANRAAQFAHRK